MSERSAKKNKKEMVSPVFKPRKSTAEKVMIAVFVVIFLAVIGLGGWAVADKIIKEKAAETPVTEEQQTVTVGQIALEEGLSVEEFLKKVGLESSGLTEESTSEELFEVMTVTGFAAFENMEVGEFKKKYKIEDVSDDTPWTTARGKVTMGTLAEIEGISFEEFAQGMGFPPEVTAETTQDEFQKIIEELYAAN